MDDAELAEALAFADAATTLLLHLPTGAGQKTMHPGLVALVEDRAEVHQATGMISVQAVLGLAEALLLLRAHAYAADRPILDVARDVIAGLSPSLRRTTTMNSQLSERPQSWVEKGPKR